MFSTFSYRRLVLASVLLGGGTLALAQYPQQPTTPSPDSSKTNQPDQSSNQPSADQQRSAPSDRDITQQIRQSIVDDKTLSTYAHNVKVITHDGLVTLRGPVRSDDEKRAIEIKAAEVAGEVNVVSDLTVEPKH